MDICWRQAAESPVGVRTKRVKSSNRAVASRGLTRILTIVSSVVVCLLACLLGESVVLWLFYDKAKLQLEGMG